MTAQHNQVIVGPAATFAAVVVALWTARFPYRPKIKLHFSSRTLLADENGVSRQAVSVTVMNVCNRPVIIHSWSIKLPAKGERFLNINRYASPYNRALPYKLDVDDSLTLLFYQSKFYETMERQIKDGAISRDKKIEFIVEYGPGKTRTVKSDDKLGDITCAIDGDRAKGRV